MQMKYNQATLQTHYAWLICTVTCLLIQGAEEFQLQFFFFFVDAVLCSTAGGDIKLITINGVNQQDGSLSNLTFILYEMMRISYYPENLSFLINVEILWIFLKMSTSRAWVRI